MKTTDKGDIGVAKVTIDLIQKGWRVAHPVSATSPFDLVICNIIGIFRRVQVKYVSAKNGCLYVDSRITINNKKSRSRSNTEIDVLAVYCPETDGCYYINIEKQDEEHIDTYALRIAPSKNKQKKNIRNAEDYRSLF